MEQTIRMYKALTEPTRLRILALLEHGELCVCDLMDVLQLPQSTVSRHLAQLKNAEWVAERRQGTWKYYRMADTDGARNLHLRKTLLEHLAELTEVRDDRHRLVGLRRQKEQQACR